MSNTLSPPANERPISTDGAHTDAWLAHFQEVTDAINSMHTGVVDASEAKAGQVGEYLTASGGPVALTNNVAANIASLPLTAGDFEVWGLVSFAAAVTTHPTQIAASISLTANTLERATTLLGATFNIGATMEIGTAGSARINVSVPTTVYLVGFSTFTTSTMSASGVIKARRAR